MAAHLPGIASGETIATLAFSEESGKWNADGIAMQASGSGDSWTPQWHQDVRARRPHSPT